jgi:hypothetical protein
MPLPRAVVADGNLLVLVVPTLLVPTAPTVAEMTAGSVTNISCYLTSFAPTTNEAVVTDDRICSRFVTENPGKKTEMLQNVYVYNPAEPSEDEARLALIEGTVAYECARWGVPFDQAIAAGDLWDIWPIKAGAQSKLEGASNETLKIGQKLFVYDELLRDVVGAA